MISLLLAKIGLSRIEAILIGIVALTVAGSIWLGYRHYTSIVETNSTLAANQAKLELALRTQKQATDAAMGSIQDWKKTISVFEENLNALRDAQASANAISTQLSGLYRAEALRAAKDDPVAGTAAARVADANAWGVLRRATAER